MLNVKELFTIGIAIFFFMITLNGKEKVAVKCLLFLLPFQILFTSTTIPIGLNGAIIWSIWIAGKIRGQYFYKEAISWQSISPAVLWLYYFLIAGFLIGISQNENLDGFTTISQSKQILNYSLYLITVIMFLKIMVAYKDEPEFQKELQYIFMLSVFLQLLPYILPLLGSSAFAEAMVEYSAVEFNDTLIMEDVRRFSGIIGDYELVVDYTLMVIAIAYTFILSGAKKTIPIIVLVTAVAVAFLSGTRSFLIVLPLFFVLYFLLNSILIRKENFSIRPFIHFVVVCIILAGMYSQFSDLPIFLRFEEALGMFRQKGNIYEASNRNLLSTIPLLTENISPVGAGSLYFTTIKGDEMVSHNLWLAIYAKYGIPGLLLLLFLFVKSAWLLLRKVRSTHHVEQKRELLILFSLLICLFVQELKISALRYQTSMLLYAFLFILIFYKLNPKEIKYTIR